MAAPAGLHLLLVDDEREFAQTLAARLRLRGVNTRVAFDGEEALASLRQGEFDLVLLDVGLPGMSGLDVLRRIREDRPGLPVALLTGNAGAKDAEEGLTQGALAYLTKPLALEELLALLARLGTRKGSTL